MPKKLREYKVMFERVARGKHALGPDDWIEALGRRSKLGGEPDWVQSPETPNCAHCHKPMSFVGQIDSIEHYATANPHRQDFKDQHYMFGDVGMFYIFFCFKCLETKSIFQCG
jgi:hypothetical protein